VITMVVMEAQKLMTSCIIHARRECWGHRFLNSLGLAPLGSHSEHSRYVM
jgi:hypothetical protein